MISRQIFREEAWHLGKSFLIFWLPAMFLLAGGLGALYTIDVGNREALLRHREQAVIDETLHALGFRLTLPHSDALYLARKPNLRQLVASGATSDRQRVVNEFTAFLSSRLEYYDQVRYLDEGGREVVRVNNAAGAAEVVPPQELQDKVDRYYVRDTLALPTGAVYISPFDLNVENGQVEVPYKPTIRVASRVVDAQGKGAGLVVLNYLGQTLIERLQRIARPDGSSLWLANGRGDWLLAPRAKDSWAFMFADTPAATLPSQYPAVWQALQAGGQRGQVMLADGLVTYGTYDAAGEAQNGRADGSDPRTRWHAVAYMPRASLHAGAAQGYWLIFALLSMPITGGALGLSILRLRRRQAEAAIRASESRFRALLQSAPDGMVVSDAGGNMVLVNVQAERLFGYEQKEMLGRPVEMLIPERFRRHHTSHRAGFMASPGVREMGAGRPLFGLRKDGSEFPVSISLNTIESEDGCLVVSDIRDVSSQQANEARIHALNHELKMQNAALSSVNRELEAFSYSVSHDLRAPLRSVDGFSQILLEDHAGQIDEEGRAYLNRIRAATQRMAQLIDDMLTLSRVSRAEMQWSEVNLSALAEEILHDYRRSEPQRVVTTQVAPGVVTRGDLRLLRIALENLLGNAWKFTSRKPEARIEFGQEPCEDGMAFFVRDTGAGFDMTYADKLFRAFQRLHAASDFPGTGIGLAIVQRVIHKHGGRVWAEGEEGKGAVFHFTLQE